jgi:hypothetical protein
MDATREIEYKMEERLSKNTCCSNINTKKEIPSFLEVKDEKSSHNRRKVMSKLIKHVLENNKDVKIESALGDGSSMIVMRNIGRTKPPLRPLRVEIHKANLVNI